MQESDGARRRIRGGYRLVISAFACPVRAMAVLSRLLPFDPSRTRRRTQPPARPPAPGLPRRNVSLGQSHRSLLLPAQDELRTARQPGAPPSLALVSALP